MNKTIIFCFLIISSCSSKLSSFDNKKAWEEKDTFGILANPIPTPSDIKGKWRPVVGGLRDVVIVQITDNSQQHYNREGKVIHNFSFHYFEDPKYGPFVMTIMGSMAGYNKIELKGDSLIFRPYVLFDDERNNDTLITDLFLRVSGSNN